MSTIVKTNLDKHISSKHDLIDYFVRGAKTEEAWGIGTEMEKLVIDSRSGNVAKFSIIEELLQRLLKLEKWEGVYENGHLIALIGDVSSITLEPGGQLELSGKLCGHIHCSFGDFQNHIRDILAESEGLGLTFLGLGLQPFSTVDEIDLVPKERYAVMGPHLARTADMGHRMLKQTAGLQVNLDYSDERDCIDKLRLGMALAPLFYALFANSPIMDGKPGGYLSSRGEIWQRTDPTRTGLIHELFEEDAGFHTYINYALDIPMYFIYRKGHYIDMTRKKLSFRQYMKEGFNQEQANLSDWDLHLSTIYTEARLRPQLELRPADSLPPYLTLSVAALTKGIFFDAEARMEIWEMVKPLSRFELESLYHNSWRIGLKTPFRKISLQHVAIEAIRIAKESLKRQGKKNGKGLDESVYLTGIEEIAESGRNLAESLLEKWHGSREEKIELLKRHCGYI